MYIENESELEPKFRPGDIVKTPTREEFLTKFGFVEVEEDDGEGGISKELYKYDKDGNELDAYRTGILSACRLIKNGLKQEFDLEKAKQGAKLETKLGYKARIVCFDANRSFSLVVLVSEPRGKYFIEQVYFYNEDGIRWEEKHNTKNDLIIVPSLNPSNP